MNFASFLDSEIFTASSDSLDVFARCDEFAQLAVVFHVLNVLSACSDFAGAAESQPWKMKKNMLIKMKATQRVNMTKTMRKKHRLQRSQGYSIFYAVFTRLIVGLSSRLRRSPRQQRS